MSRIWTVSDHFTIDSWSLAKDSSNREVSIEALCCLSLRFELNSLSTSDMAWSPAATILPSSMGVFYRIRLLDALLSPQRILAVSHLEVRTGRKYHRSPRQGKATQPPAGPRHNSGRLLPSSLIFRRS